MLQAAVVLYTVHALLHCRVTNRKLKKHRKCTLVVLQLLVRLGRRSSAIPPNKPPRARAYSLRLHPTYRDITNQACVVRHGAIVLRSNVLLAGGPGGLVLTLECY